MSSFLFRLKRGNSPLLRSLRSTARTLQTSNVPVPRLFAPFFRFLFNLHHFVGEAWLRLISWIYWEPLFLSRCRKTGKNIRLYGMPYVIGHMEIEIGDNVNFFGVVDIFSGAIFDQPVLRIGNGVDIGHHVGFVVNKEIVIEDNVNIATGAKFMDSDAHPRDAAARAADLPPAPEEIKPVRICRSAWIGQNAFILKGVTVGEGAIVGVNSVVVTDVPPYSVVMGNPAKVVFKGTPAQAAAPKAPGE